MAQELGDEIEEISIIGSSPLSGAIISDDSPYQVQSFSAEDIQSSQANTIADLLDTKASGVTINHAQNNPLQPDVQIRGYSASPLLGAPQGVAVYWNGSRINEPFADTVNWDLLGTENIQALSLLSGANAAFGLNALGGSLILNTKTGFDENLSSLSGSYGSFERRVLGASHGDNNGRWGYLISVDNFDEEGWRDFSASKSTNLYSSLSLRDEKIHWDLFALLGDTNLHGNGASPETLLDLDRKAVFTHPDITENNLFMLSSQNKIFMANNSRINTNIFYRKNSTESFNGDGSEFEECDPPFDSFLCEEDEMASDQFGNPVDESFDAINNTGDQEQTSMGATIEYLRFIDIAGTAHENIFGFDVYLGETEFESAVEFATLQSDRSTSGSGLFDEEGATELQAKNRYYSVYWLDTFKPTDKLKVNLSLRYNHSQVITADTSDEVPELNGNHTYVGWNGGLGFTYDMNDSLQLYSSVHQSSRVPTPIELACSHPDAPCTLPNTFLADPPLDEVVARNVELGFRSKGEDKYFWQVNSFYSAISDDIIFQATGGVSSNEGFFSNASDTQRLGFTANYGIDFDSLSLNFSYAWMAATFEDNFIASSPNHPNEVSGLVLVRSGDNIPGLPEHNVNASLLWSMSENWELDMDVHYQSGVYLRGDEANQDDKTDRAFVVDSQARYSFDSGLSLSISITNLLDSEFESFGLYGEPDEVIPSLGDENTRFLSPNEPRGLWLGLRYQW